MDSTTVIAAVAAFAAITGAIIGAVHLYADIRKDKVRLKIRFPDYGINPPTVPMAITNISHAPCSIVFIGHRLRTGEYIRHESTTFTMGELQPKTLEYRQTHDHIISETDLCNLKANGVEKVVVKTHCGETIERKLPRKIRKSPQGTLSK